MAELFAGQRNRRRVYQRRHFFNVVEKKFVKENFVCILEGPQIDVALQVIGFFPEGFIGAERLLIKCLYLWRKQSSETKFRSLVSAERRTFIQKWSIEEIHPTRAIHAARLDCIDCGHDCSFPFS